MLFFPNQQELDCFNDNGILVGKIKFDAATDKHDFHPDKESMTFNLLEEENIAERIAGLDLGLYSIPMQDDD